MMTTAIPLADSSADLTCPDPTAGIASALAPARLAFPLSLWTMRFEGPTTRKTRSWQPHRKSRELVKPPGLWPPWPSVQQSLPPQTSPRYFSPSGRVNRGLPLPQSADFLLYVLL